MNRGERAIFSNFFVRAPPACLERVLRATLPLTDYRLPYFKKSSWRPTAYLYGTASRSVFFSYIKPDCRYVSRFGCACAAVPVTVILLWALAVARVWDVED